MFKTTKLTNQTTAQFVSLKEQAQFQHLLESCVHVGGDQKTPGRNLASSHHVGLGQLRQLLGCSTVPAEHPLPRVLAVTYVWEHTCFCLHLEFTPDPRLLLWSLACFTRHLKHGHNQAVTSPSNLSSEESGLQHDTKA